MGTSSRCFRRLGAWPRALRALVLVEVALSGASCAGCGPANPCGGALHPPSLDPVLTIGPGSDGAAPTSLVVFGDSLSDTGALLAQSVGVAPNPDGYWAGRFANGPVWVDYVADALGVPAESHAYGGAATTGDAGAIPKPFDAAVADYLGCVDRALDGALDSDGVFALWIGHNDYYQGSDDPEAAVATTLQALRDLAARGARRFLVPALLPLSGTPRPVAETAGGLDDATADARVAAHNALLRAGLDALAPELDVTVAHATPAAMRERLLADPGRLGLRNTTDRCFGGDVYWLTGGRGEMCSEPDRFFFWDGVHPTTRVHCAYAVEMLRALGDAGVTAPLIDDPALLARCERVSGELRRQ